MPARGFAPARRRPPLGFSPSAFQSDMVSSGNSGPPSVTAHASANTKGDYSTLMTLTRSCNGFYLWLGGTSATGKDFLLDISADGGTTNFITNIQVSQGGNSTKSFIYIPMYLPVGAVVAARCQCGTGGTSTNCGVLTASAGSLGIPQLRSSVTYGASTTDSGGTSIDPGAGANTKGTAVELSAATTAPIKYLIVCIGNQVNTARTDADYLMDILVGSTVLIPDIHFTMGAGIDIVTPGLFGFWVDIPKGVQLQVQAQSTTTDATDRLFDVTLIGLTD